MKADVQRLPAESADSQSEAAETQRALREISLMIEQSQGELAKLTQRNASISAHLQQVQQKIDQTPPQEVRMAYDAALDAQQRLFVMRAQLEKLHSESLQTSKDS